MNICDWKSLFCISKQYVIYENKNKYQAAEYKYIYIYIHTYIHIYIYIHTKPKIYRKVIIKNSKTFLASMNRSSIIPKL